MKKLFIHFFSLLLIFSMISFLSCEEEEEKLKLENTTWDVTFDWENGGSGTASLTFYDSGSTNWSGAEWTLTDDQVEWSWEWESESGSMITTTYSGTMEDNQHMSGTCTNTGGDSGDWSAVRNDAEEKATPASSMKEGAAL